MNKKTATIVGYAILFVAFAALSLIDLYTKEEDK